MWAIDRSSYEKLAIYIEESMFYDAARRAKIRGFSSICGKNSSRR